MTISANQVGSRTLLHLVFAFMVGLMLAACQSLKTYDGPKLPRDEVARIWGDLRISAGAPMSLILRRVGAMDLGLRYRGVNVLPGQHDVLIDCTVTESRHISRHHLTVEVAAGRTYRFEADTSPGNRECANVRLVESD
jgi:hypothetical protein